MVLLPLAFARLRSHHSEDISRTDIVDRIATERGAPMADRTLTLVRRIMNWHANRSHRSPIIAA